jgi:hypothetical protein
LPRKDFGSIDGAWIGCGKPTQILDFRFSKPLPEWSLLAMAFSAEEICFWFPPPVTWA